MNDQLRFYIDGHWVEPLGSQRFEAVSPVHEKPIGQVAMGNAADVDRAVAAARAAFPSFSTTTPEQRRELLGIIQTEYQERSEDLAAAISTEMGAPITLARTAQAGAGLVHLGAAAAALDDIEFREQKGTSLIIREAIGVCGMITPWNWPANQIMCKVAPALAAGCTMVLKPSEYTPYSAVIIAEILDAAGVPPGVFNLVMGDGPTVGAAISSHPDIDMVSFTGSTRAGVEVARAAAATVKRVTQELGGKSANIILDDADIAASVEAGVRACVRNSGQSCNAPTRMLVPRDRHAEAVSVARAAAEQSGVGDPTDPDTAVGPVVNEVQWKRIQGLIAEGIDEGAELVSGGTGKPEGLEVGWFVKPTVFANVNNQMTIAREEIFGPVLAIIPYDTEDEAIAIANDTPYGLSGYVQSGDIEHAAAVGAQLRTGQVHLNGARPDFSAPFGGYKTSGNGREWGAAGVEEFLETKALMGLPE